MFRPSLLPLALLMVAPLAADVVGTPSTNGFEIVHRVNIKAPRDDVFRAFRNVAAWWNPEHTYTLDAKNLTMDPRPGGGFLETIPGGGFVHHLRLGVWLPGKMVRLLGGLGPLQEHSIAGAMTIEFADDAGGTVVTVTYRVGAFVDGGLAGWAEPVDGVIGEQFRRLKNYVEGTGE